MADSASSTGDFAQYAGRVAFPRSPSDLTDTTRCPACLTPLRTAVCSECGLDLRHPAAAELAELSLDAATVLARRLTVIGRIRFETRVDARLADRSPDRQTNDDEATVERVPVAVPAAASPPIAPGLTAPGPIAPRPIAPRPHASGPPVSEPHISAPPAPRRSSVQVILLIVGISLLSIAAIFFLVYAFINFGVLGRSLIIAAVTVAACVTASALRRGTLTATAEGIAVLAVVLVYLDAFAIRANDFFGSGSSNGAVFWGGTLAITSALFVLWYRASGLRAASIIAFGAFVPGIGLLVGGLLDRESVDGASKYFLAFGAAALAGGIHRTAISPSAKTRPANDGRPERILMLSATSIALFAAFVTAAFVTTPFIAAASPVAGVRPGSVWFSALAYVALAAIGAIHVWLLRTLPDGASRAFAAILAGFTGVSAAIAVGSAALRAGNEGLSITAPAVAATVVALGLELCLRRLAVRGHPLARGTRIAAWSAGAVAAGTLIVPVSIAVSVAVRTVVRALGASWTLSPTAELSVPSAAAAFSVLALAIVGMLLLTAWAAAGSLRQRTSILSWFAVALLVLAVPLASTLWAVLALWLALAVGAFVALVIQRQRPRRYRAPLFALLSASGMLGYLVGWGSTSTWWIGSAVVFALLIALRRVIPSPAGRAISLGAASLVLLVTAAAGARQIALPSAPTGVVDVDNAIRAVGLVGILLVTLSAFSLRARPARPGILDRRVLYWTGLASTALSFAVLFASLVQLPVGLRMTLLLPEYGTSLAASAVMLVVLLIWLVRATETAFRIERVVASVALAPLLTLLLDAFVRMLGLPDFGRSVVPVSAALLVSAGSLARSLLRPGRLRLPRELGIVLVGLPTLLTSVARGDDSTWLVLVLGGVAVLVLSISADGVFSSTSPRRHLAWLALALATGGLWWRLSSSGVTDLEPYVLPLSGMLLLIAILVARASQPEAPQPEASPMAGAGRPAPLIALAGLLVAILPLAITGSNGPLARALIVGGVAAILLLAGSVVPGVGTVRPYLDVAALSGAIGVLVIMVGRAVDASSGRGGADLSLDAWLFGGALVLTVAGFGQCRDRSSSSTSSAITSSASTSRINTNVSTANTPATATTDSDRWRAIAGSVLAFLAISAVLLLELPAFGQSPLGPNRALVVVFLLSALHIAGFVADRAPFTRALAWISIAYAVVAAVGGFVSGALPRVELGSIPIAAALLVTGSLALSRTPTARTWAWLAPGVSVLLFPSLAATAVDAPPWRLVGLGVVAATIIVASVPLRLQAPFLIAATVELIHLIATFAPGIRAVYQSVEWWLWFVPVGIIVVVFAARFEKSMRQFRSVALRIRALR